MSETVEPFTARIVKSLPDSVEVVTLQEAPRLKLLSRRTHATFERHNHAKAGTASTATATPRPSPMASTATPGSTRTTPVAMVDRIEQALSAKDPAHAAVFKANATALRAKLEALAAELDSRSGADRQPALHRLPRCLPVPGEPLRPQRGRLDLDQPGGAGERQAPHRAAPQDRRAGRGVRVRRAALRSRAWSTT